MATPHASTTAITKKAAVGRTKLAASPSTIQKAKATAPQTKTAASKTASATAAAPTVAAKPAPVRKSASKEAASVPAPQRTGTKRVQATARAVSREPAAPPPEQRYRMIQEAAYFLAENNGFEGHAADYWAAAEREIHEVLAAERC